MSRPLSASQRSSTLAALLAFAAALLVVLGEAQKLRPPVGGGHPLIRDVLLVTMFAAADYALLHIEFHREAYSFSLSGVPLAIGAMIVTPGALVWTRLAGTALVFMLQRPDRQKAVYNLSSYAFEAALISVATSALAGGGHGLSLASGAVMAGLLLATDALMSTLVLLVISWHSGPLDRRERIRVYGSGTIIAALAVLLGLTAIIVATHGALGRLVLIGLLVIFVVIHRAYAALHRRHESLELVHQFVSRATRGLSLDDLVRELLSNVCTSLRATSAIMLLDSWEGQQRVLAVNESGSVLSQPAASPPVDWLCERVIAAGAPAIVPRGTSAPDLRRWLESHGFRDAIVVPVADSDGLIGTMVVSDRQGETATFHADDVPVAETLAAHMAVALRNAALLQRLRYQANHDALTGIANRTLLQDTLDQVHDDVEARETCAALLLLDLDRFKDVNDVLGHVAGDRLLCVVADRLEALAQDGLVARLGGDEFAVLLTDIGDAEAAEAFAHEAIAALKGPVYVNDIALNAEASIGVAVFTPGRIAPGELLRKADLAMYAVKGSGRAVGLYTQDLERGQADRLALVADLRVGIDRDELVMLYQPKIDLRTGMIVGLEALVRWQHPKLGVLAPDSFIHLAESAGLIDQLTDTALRLALTQCRRWHDAGFGLTVAVNLSARNLHDPHLPRRVKQQLDDVGLRAESLTLEITEGSVVSEPERTIPVLVELAELGCVLSLDDFGTGYSSLSYLQNLPVKEVKIDRSFVTGFVGDQRREALVAAIIGLGESLQLLVVAEGIEDADTERQLRRMGCGGAQGYFIGVPATPAALEALLDARGTRSIHCGPWPQVSRAPAGAVAEQRSVR